MSRPPRPLIGLNTSLTVGESGERHISVPADYVQALVDAGGIPLLVSPLLDRSAIAETLRHMQGILFIGGRIIGQPTMAVIHNLKMSFSAPSGISSISPGRKQCSITPPYPS